MNPPEPVQWGPGIIVIVVGVVFAAIVLFLLRRKAVPVVETNDRLADLDRKVVTLLEQLRELGADQHLLNATDFATEKARLEKETAEALKARDEYAAALTRANAMTAEATGGKPGAAPATQPTGFLAGNPQLKGALWGAGIVGFFVLLGVLLTQESKPREENKGGAPMTGGGAPQATAAQTEDREFQELQKKYNANPDDVDLSAQLVHEMLRRQDFTNASAITERALTQDPFHTESRIHRQVLRGLKGDTMGSLEELEKIGAAQPDGQEALLFAGALAMEVDDKRRALADFQRYAASAKPEDQPPQLRQGIALLERQVAEMDGKAPVAVPGPDMPQQDSNV
ncbi:MAG: tetratricopeptide repeat protein, partial [Myxococcaceae bacterium]